MAGLVGFSVIDGDRRNDIQALSLMWDLLADASNGEAVEQYRDEDICCSFDVSGISNEHACFVESDIAVWLDGEIYDFGFSSEKLGPNRDVAAIIADLYRRHSLQFFKSVDGIFSAIIYDRIRKQLHLVSDRGGLRELYVWISPDRRLVWGSKLRSFLEAPGFSPRIDREALADFIEIGHMMEDRTWFDGVVRLASATILTWDLSKRQAQQQRYWWWDEIKPISGHIDESEIVEEVGNRFLQAVSKRIQPNERVGLCLSGGRDSRAVLGAMPSDRRPIHVLTFGIDGCADRVIASQVADRHGAVSHQFALHEKNWLAPRIDGIWFSDGQYDLMHMHGIEAIPFIRHYFDVDMTGFIGDISVGGDRIVSGKFDAPITAKAVANAVGCKPDRIVIGDEYSSLRKLDYFVLQNRSRRFIYGGMALSAACGLPCRAPFHDNRLLELVYSLPDSFRFDGRLYNKMLLERFPSLFESIPWQATGVPISYSRSRRRWVHTKKRIQRKLSILSGGLVQDPFARQSYVDYDTWIREEPARSFFEKLLKSPHALYPTYLKREMVLSDWEEHLAGRNCASAICRYATFEIWLRQAFRQEFRPERHRRFDTLRTIVPPA